MSRRITLLDGSMGYELQHRGLGDRDIWSTRALLDGPEVVRQLHEDYIAVGAHVITTNSYAVTPLHLDRIDGLRAQAVELLDLAGRLAVEARDRSGRPEVLIAASIPPIGESYRPDLVPSAEEMADWYGVMVEALRPHVDLWLSETMSSIAEADAALTATAAESAPTWVAWTLTDHRTAALRSGESLADAVREASRHRPEALLLNCSQPRTITAAMPVLAGAARSVPFGGFANGFPPVPEDYGQQTVFADYDRPAVATYVEHVVSWVSHGATIVGGCCDIGPDHMAAVASSLT